MRIFLTFDENSMFAAIYLHRFPFEQRAQGKLFAFKPMNKIAYTKLVLSYADQIQILNDGGLSI